jgi:dissimilatory sulfite reductase related protein
MRLEQQPTTQSPDVVASTLTINAKGRLVELDQYGYLIDSNDWSAAITEQMAEADNLVLTDDHWLLIDFLHRYYREYQLAPELPILSRSLCKDQKDCRWTRKYIRKLFPGDARTACRYAGLPAPVGRSCV